jgi:carboxymethylenebutenolidase
VTVEVYAGADHGFTWPDHATYDEPAATGAWTATTALFRRALT